MEQLGYESANFVYELQPPFTQTGVASIMLVSIIDDGFEWSDNAEICGEFTEYGQDFVAKFDYDCAWCRSPDVIYGSVRDGYGFTYMTVRCNACQTIIDRMFEYWENRHPLLKDLSPNDYLKTDCREPLITAKCNELRNQLCTEIFALRNFLHKDLCSEIINIQLEIIYKEFRITADELIV